MRKWKLLLSTLGVITPLAIATPFIVSCSGGEEKQVEEKQYRFYTIKNGSIYTVYKQVLEGYDNYFQPIWKNMDDGKTIDYKDWDKFVQKANAINVPIVFQ